MMFRPIEGVWKDCSDGTILADVLFEYDLLIDDRTQFARIYDYERRICFWYRSKPGCVKLTLWAL